MNEVFKDLINYKNLFPNTEYSVTEQAPLIKWSERKCYVYKHFISKLSETDINILKNYDFQVDYEIVGAISIHKPSLREVMLKQLERIHDSESMFDEILVIITENSAPNPLTTISND